MCPKPLTTLIEDLKLTIGIEHSDCAAKCASDPKCDTFISYNDGNKTGNGFDIRCLTGPDCFFVTGCKTCITGVLYRQENQRVSKLGNSGAHLPV